jgi:hypothetical protein
VQGVIGPKGDKGDTGAQGVQGVAGPPGTTTWAGITDKPTTIMLGTLADGTTPLKAWAGTAAQYTALPVKDNATLYFTTP